MGKDGCVRSLNHLYMNGPEIFTFTLKRVPSAVESLLALADITREEIDLYVFHQANKFMLDALRVQCRLDEERFYIGMANKGNTVSSSIPIALADAVSQDKAPLANKLMLAGFGVGLSWAACLVVLPSEMG